MVGFLEAKPITMHSPNVLGLNQGHFCLARSIWQCLETFLSVTTGWVKGHNDREARTGPYIL
jgi:hypothetical protein